MSIIKALVELSPLSKSLRRGVPSFNQLGYGRSKLFSQSLRLLFCAGLLMSATALQAATWYVSSTVASSGNGQSWATAWKNSSNIQWGSIAAGDTIYFDGGTSGLSYGAFSTITASGTANNYITIARSTEPGRDGIVTIATAFTISGSYIKFDGGGYKQVSGSSAYRCGIVFTCSGNAFAGNIPSGSAVAATGQRPWFRYCYFNGTYGAGSGHSFGANNSTGFVLERCWFYQSNYEDQWVYAASSAGGSVSITNTVFQDNNKPNRNDTSHRDVANPWTGSGGWNLYIIGCMLFNTPGHASDQPQGDEFLLQVGYSGSATPLNDVIAINNVCYNTARFIAFGSSNSGVNRFVMYNNTIRSVMNGNGLGITVTSPAGSPTEANNIQNSTSNPGFINATSPLGADGIPFTADDGFNITSTSSAINAGSSVGVASDIRGNARIGNPDLGAYEYGSSGQAMAVSAGADKSITLPSTSTTIAASVTNPTNGTPVLAWTMINGPAAVSFSAPAAATTTVTFSTAGTYTLRLTATVAPLSVSDDVVVTVNPAAQVSGLNFEAESGTVTAPFVSSSGAISQPSETGLSGSGRATYSFMVTNTGDYLVLMNVNAPSEARNSLFLNIDAEPEDPDAIWHIPVTSGFETRTASWQGGGTYAAPEFVPKAFTLTAGTHQLIIRGRESGVEINSITIVKQIAPPTNLRVSSN